MAPDLARGFMLLLIAAANSSFYLWGHEASLYSPHPHGGSALDRALQFLMAVFVDGRIYPLFALLFGYGMVQLARSRVGRGWAPDAIRRTLNRRHLWLVLFGCVHAVLLFGGDILGAYGLTGLVLVALLFNAKDTTIRAVIIVCAVLFLGSGLLSALSALGLGLWLASDPLLAAEVATSLETGSFGSLADLMSGQPNYLVAALFRLVTWLISTPSVVLGLSVPTMVLIGWLAARHGILENPAAHRTLLRRVALWGSLIGWAGGVPMGLVHAGVWHLSDAVGWGPLALLYALGPFAGAGYAAAFALLALRLGGTPGRLAPVAALGRRSLSGYLFQSLAMAPLLAAWGFGVGARMHTAGMLAIALAVWLAAVPLAWWLESTGRPGPFEALLRRLIGRPDAVAAPPAPAPPPGAGGPGAAAAASDSR